MKYKKIVWLLVLVCLCILITAMNMRRMDNGENYTLNLTKDKCRKGNTIRFGCYPQDTHLGKEPIEWQVLQTTGDSAILISKYILDNQDYHVPRYEADTWLNSSLREWLNNQFFAKAFNKQEKEYLVPFSFCADGKENSDWVICPAKQMILDGFERKIDRKAVLTEYTEKKAWKENVYWLIGQKCVKEDGTIEDFPYIPSTGKGYGVRPVIMVRLRER